MSIITRISGKNSNTCLLSFLFLVDISSRQIYHFLPFSFGSIWWQKLSHRTWVIVEHDGKWELFCSPKSLLIILPSTKQLHFMLMTISIGRPNSLMVYSCICKLTFWIVFAGMKLLTPITSDRSISSVEDWSFLPHKMAPGRRFWEPVSLHLNVSAGTETVICGYWVGPDIEDGWGFVNAFVNQILWFLKVVERFSMASFPLPFWMDLKHGKISIES